MRGILYYAGIGPKDAAELFSQNDATMRQLKKASITLNETLKAGWIQGRDLQYELTHDSASKQVLLRAIEDPAVGSRLVRASRQSRSGFTHFFALEDCSLCTTAGPRYPANSYIFLFVRTRNLSASLWPARSLATFWMSIGKRQPSRIHHTFGLFMLNRTPCPTPADCEGRHRYGHRRQAICRPMGTSTRRIGLFSRWHRSLRTAYSSGRRR